MKEINLTDIHVKQLATVRVLSLRFVATNHLHFARVTAEIRTALQANTIPVSG